MKPFYSMKILKCSYLSGCAQLAVIETGLHHPGMVSLPCTASTSAVHQDKDDIAPFSSTAVGVQFFLVIVPLIK